MLERMDVGLDPKSGIPVVVLPCIMLNIHKAVAGKKEVDGGCGRGEELPCPIPE